MKNTGNQRKLSQRRYNQYFDGQGDCRDTIGYSGGRGGEDPSDR